MGRIGIVRVSDEVESALSDGTPVIALESTVFSRLGLPQPANADALSRCLSTFTDNGTVPGVTAVIRGEVCLGLGDSELEQILDAETKIASRDLSIAIAEKIPVGVTTVSASLAIADAAGVKVFCTGGIGGIHHGYEETGDLSADLYALAKHQVICVSAGAKAFLDLPRTVEMLESLGVPVLGWKTDEFPAFYLRTSGVPIHQIEEAATVVNTLKNAAALNLPQGVLVSVPIPEKNQLDPEKVWSLIDKALIKSKKLGIRGPEVTPFILDALAKETDGESIPANLALLENNAQVAVKIAKEFQSRL